MAFPLFQLVQTLYWLALSTWFGAVLFIAVAAPIILRTVRESDPTLPTILSVNLEGQHAVLLGGSIVLNLLRMLLRVELACAAAMAACIAGQWAMQAQAMPTALVRTALFVAAVILMIYDWRLVLPRINQYRQEYIDHADEPERANPAQEQFDRYQRESMLVLMIIVTLLLGVIVFSTSISQAQRYFITR